MKEIVIEILEKGDELFSFENDRIVVKTKNGEYVAYNIVFDDLGFPRIDTDNIARIVFGKNKCVRVNDSEAELSVETF